MDGKSWEWVRWTQGLTSVGDGAFYVVSAAVLLGLGFSAARVGLVLSVAWGVAMLTTPLVGRLADRVGLRGGALGLTVPVAAGLLVVVTGPDPAWTSAGLLIYAVGQAGLGGIRHALVVPLAAGTGRSATTERATLQAIGNAGIAVGAGLGGAALAAGSLPLLRGVLVLDAALFLASMALLRALPLDRPGLDRPVLDPPGDRATAVAVRPGPRYLALTTCAAMMYLYMPLHHARRNARRGGALMAVCCLLFWAALSAPGLPWLLAGMLLAVCVQVLGEVTFASGAWDLGYRLAPLAGAGTWQGTFAAAVPASRSVGPALLSWLLVAGGLWGFAALGVVFLVAGQGSPCWPDPAHRYHAPPQPRRPSQPRPPRRVRPSWSGQARGRARRQHRAAPVGPDEPDESVGRATRRPDLSYCSLHGGRTRSSPATAKGECVFRRGLLSALRARGRRGERPGMIVGSVGRVTGAIGPGLVGEVILSIRGGSEAFNAYAYVTGESLPIGSLVQVVEYHEPRTLYVALARV